MVHLKMVYLLKMGIFHGKLLVITRGDDKLPSGSANQRWLTGESQLGEIMPRMDQLGDPCALWFWKYSSQYN
jgi:hypothetical protein